MQIINRPKSGGQEFVDALQPFLALAMQNMLQRKMAERQYQQNLQRAQQLQPELFQQTAQVPTPQGQQQVAYSPAMGKIPTSLRFMQNKAQPGQEFNATTGELSYKATQPDFFSQYIKMQGLGGLGGQTKGIQLPASTIEEAKANLIESGENPADYKFKPIINKGVQIGFVPELDTTLQNNRISNEKQGQFIKESAQDTLNTIGEIKKGMKYFGATGGIPSLPWDYDRKNWEANINKLLSGKVVELITTMKSASKTGATGFGQLSEKEGQLIKEASTALNKGLSSQDAIKYLDQMEPILKKVLSGNRQNQNDFSTMSDEELRAIAGGK